MDLLLISQRIRSLRQARNLTVEQLAQLSGFSKGFISQVENFRLTPSLKALNRISEALGVSPGELFDCGIERPAYSFGTLTNGTEIVRNDNYKFGMHYYALAYEQIGRKLEPFVVEYQPSEFERPFMRHETEEFFVLLEGELEYFVNEDDNVTIMKAGDTVYMRSGVPHRVRLKEGCEYARALILYAPEDK